MALNIENSTIGFDARNVEKALSNLNSQCIEEAIHAMDKGVSDLETALKDAWVGESADQFFQNMLTDKEFISGKLRETFNILREMMYQIMNEMSYVDQDLVKGREN